MSMDDPLGYVVEKMVQKSIEDLFNSPEFLEELRLASMPGALSAQSSGTLRDYFSADSSVGGMVHLLFEDPKVLFTYRNTPTYAECARLYHLQNLMTSSNFAQSILDTFLAVETTSARTQLLANLQRFEPVDAMNAEAISRVCTALFDKTTVALFFSLYDDSHVAFFQGILFQIGRECMKELTLRFCDDLFCDSPDQQAQWDVVPYQILAQVFPCTSMPSLVPKLPPGLDLAATSLDYKFPLMLYTCDFVTDLIQENRPDTVGRFIVTQLTTNPVLAAALVDGVLTDLQTLPTPLSCESYGMKILNSMLQLHHCGCISRHQEDSQTAREVDCQGTLNALWTAFVSRLPSFLDVLHIPPHQTFSLKHVQLLYLLYPVLRVSCIAVDELLMQDRTFETLLALVERYPNANILHTAICRLFITCLEDCPVMFGQELQTRRTIWDPLRNSLLRDAIFQTVIKGCHSRYVTCFKDIAMSFDELMMQTPPVAADIAAMWHEFATTDLEDIRAEWAINLPAPNGNGVENHLVQLSKQALNGSTSDLMIDENVCDDDEHDPFPTAAALVMDVPGRKMSLPTSSHSDTRKLAEVGSATTTTTTLSQLKTRDNMDDNVVGGRNDDGDSSRLDTIAPALSPKKDLLSPLHALYDSEENDLIRQFSKANAEPVMR
ncbi:hypothetical protein DYB35_010038 [Aphanomyces astaci]|uniref:Uncharacterized protein n=3 Tax=Aphanomyces astaci TaxID=112090 RepID=A0A3R6Z573_APHAT|nr:hypothetical protein DYB26_011096 [Aphanomyces astaci]RHY97086.1 hypothetical protein DYB35_010038 [Aphanomyces astaci]